MLNRVTTTKKKLHKEKPHVLSIAKTNKDINKTSKRGQGKRQENETLVREDGNEKAACIQFGMNGL